MKKPSKVVDYREQATSGDDFASNMKTIISVASLMLLAFLVVHCTWVTGNAYSSPSVVLASMGSVAARYRTTSGRRTIGFA